MQRFGCIRGCVFGARAGRFSSIRGRILWAARGAVPRFRQRIPIPWLAVHDQDGLGKHHGSRAGGTYSASHELRLDGLSAATTFCLGFGIGRLVGQAQGQRPRSLHLHCALRTTDIRVWLAGEECRLDPLSLKLGLSAVAPRRRRPRWKSSLPSRFRGSLARGGAYRQSPGA